MTGKDYILEVKVRNGPMLRAMRAAGYFSAKALARAMGKPGTTMIYRYLALVEPPWSEVTNDWRESILEIAAYLRKSPEDLFPPQHVRRALIKTKAEVEVSLEEIGGLIQSNDDPLKITEDHDMASKVGRALLSLPPRHQKVLAMKFGLSGPERSLEEIAKNLGVSEAEAKQIELSAMRKLKHPSRSRILRGAWSGENLPEWKDGDGEEEKPLEPKMRKEVRRR